MVALEGARFAMGSTENPEEGPVAEVWVDGFEIDRFAVTNEQYAEFVDDTGYVTIAERALNPNDFPDAQLEQVDPGSLVFTPTLGPVDLGDWRQWWRWQPGAMWRAPERPGSDIAVRLDHPVVHIADADAVTYSHWADKRLPTEAEWEYAARGGLRGARFTWGEASNQRPEPYANTWQAHFPYLNTGARGWRGTASVGSFPPNGFGLHEMTGNTWEWTSTAWNDRHYPSGCNCQPNGERANQATEPFPQRVTKGGSHLCAPEYCLRYRPAARSPQTGDSAASHIGFRCARG